jgi:ABC-2 type transport system ATP-binding protein
VIADDLVVIGNGRIVAQGAKSDLLRSAGSIIRTLDRDVIAHALLDSGITSTPVGQDGLLAHGDVAQVGQIAFAAGVQLTELRPADGAGLEEMFIELTDQTQRDTTQRDACSGIHPEGAVA